MVLLTLETIFSNKLWASNKPIKAMDSHEKICSSAQKRHTTLHVGFHGDLAFSSDDVLPTSDLCTAWLQGREKGGDGGALPFSDANLFQIERQQGFWNSGSPGRRNQHCSHKNKTLSSCVSLSLSLCLSLSLSLLFLSVFSPYVPRLSLSYRECERASELSY